ncbi:MAG: nucleic acid-binding protein [Dehalococcoidia bacterium]
MQDTIIVTTDEVLVEYLGYISGHGSASRRKASETLRATLADPNVRVIPQSRETMLRGLARFDRRPDKAYSLVDCVSMNVMDDLGIHEALTADHHFEQEGFVALMRG